MAELLYKIGTELTLEEKILPFNWKNVSKLLNEKDLLKIEQLENWGLKLPTAYTKILFVRKYGKVYYGDFPAPIGEQYRIEACNGLNGGLDYLVESCKFSVSSNNPLVFNNRNSCGEFIKNNKDLLTELLGVE